MEKVKVGELITDAAAGRDAIHVAIVPVTAAVKVYPGQRVAADGTPNGLIVGIVDPFLAVPIHPGERFYLCLFPNTVTSLRHVWTHPQFKEEAGSVGIDPTTERGLSEMWLRTYAMRMNCYDTPDEAYRRLIEGLESGELFAHGSDLHGLHELDDADDLKRHGEAVLGRPINWGAFSFSCSC